MKLSTYLNKSAGKLFFMSKRATIQLHVKGDKNTILILGQRKTMYSSIARHLSRKYPPTKNKNIDMQQERNRKIMKTKAYHTFGTIPKYNRKIVKIEATSVPLKHIIHDRSFSQLDTGIALKSGAVKLFVCLIYIENSITLQRIRKMCSLSHFLFHKWYIFPINYIVQMCKKFIHVPKQ